jgi:flagellar motor switch protein FliM
VILNKKNVMPVNVQIGNRQKFYGKMGIMGIKKAAKITSQVLEEQA